MAHIRASFDVQNATHVFLPCHGGGVLLIIQLFSFTQHSKIQTCSFETIFNLFFRKPNNPGLTNQIYYKNKLENRKITHLS